MWKAIADWWQERNCPHDYKFVRNIHGDEIIFGGYGGARSIWECKLCPKILYAAEVHDTEFKFAPMPPVVPPRKPVELDGITFEQAISIYMHLANLKWELNMERNVLSGQGPIGPPGMPGFDSIIQVLDSTQKIEKAIDELKVEIVDLKSIHIGEGAAEFRRIAEKFRIPVSPAPDED